MNLRLHEIEFGASNPSASRTFYNTVLGLPIAVAQEELTVFNIGVTGVDFNSSAHLPPRTTLISFLTNDLQRFTETLVQHGVAFTGPKPSHLGTSSIEFKDPEGNTVRVAQPTADSPVWLTV